MYFEGSDPTICSSWIFEVQNSKSLKIWNEMKNARIKWSLEEEKSRQQVRVRTRISSASYLPADLQFVGRNWTTFSNTLNCWCQINRYVWAALPSSTQVVNTGANEKNVKVRSLKSTFTPTGKETVHTVHVRINWFTYFFIFRFSIHCIRSLIRLLRDKEKTWSFRFRNSDPEALQALFIRIIHTVEFLYDSVIIFLLTLGQALFSYFRTRQVDALTGGAGDVRRVRTGQEA